jgi:hypothetical protein
MKTITIHAPKSTVATASRARALTFNKRETEIALTMKAFGFTFAQAAEYLDGLAETRDAKALVKAASRVAVPAGLAAAIAADYADGANKKMKDFIAFQIASFAKRNATAMIASPATIAKLSTIYGIDVNAE